MPSTFFGRPMSSCIVGPDEAADSSGRSSLTECLRDRLSRSKQRIRTSESIDDRAATRAATANPSGLKSNVMSEQLETQWLVTRRGEICDCAAARPSRLQLIHIAGDTKCSTRMTNSVLISALIAFLVGLQRASGRGELSIKREPA
jgi:hypothetical protein